MPNDNKTSDKSEDKPSTDQSAPTDALEKSNEEIAADTTQDARTGGSSTPEPEPPKKVSGFKAFMRRFNLYLLLFGLVVVIAAVVSVVSYLNSKKAPDAPTINSQSLTTDTLKQLANSDATVGNSGQTLTVQGNAVFSGQVLIRSDLNVAGTLKVGSEIIAPKLTITGTTNLGATQINGLQVANGSTFQGTVTVQNDLNVGGATAFSGPVTAGQLTVTKLIMSGNASLQVPNHIGFPGASPGRTFNSGVVGSGGSASINGSDTTGTVNINSGNGPTAGCFINLTFNKPYSSTPHVIVTPINAAAGELQWYITRSNNGFSVCSNNAAPANQVFAFDYFITS